jgi:HAD superfamily hydrolase (TIGR01549 family)
MPERSIEDIDAAYRRFFPGHLEEIEVNSQAVPTLRRLRETGAKTALATNTNRELAETILGRFEILPLLDCVACADEAAAGKPDPAVVRLAAERLALPLERCVFVGDSVYDEKAALAAPVEFIGFRYEAGSRIEDLSEICG